MKQSVYILSYEIAMWLVRCDLVGFELIGGLGYSWYMYRRPPMRKNGLGDAGSYERAFLRSDRVQGRVSYEEKKGL